MKTRLCMFTLAKDNSVRKQCDIGDNNFETSKLLDALFSNCKIYTCSKSGCKTSFKNVIDMKEHINKLYRKTYPAYYKFSYWIGNIKGKREK